MKTSIANFAIMGGTRTFERDRVVGQLYLPDRKTFDIWFDAIFERAFYTNHGPLVSRLDEVIAERLAVKHAFAVTNGTVALMVALRGLELEGDVIVPAFTFPATVQAINWAKLNPVFADVDPVSHMLTPETVERVMTQQTSAVLGVHVWGRPCTPKALEALCVRRGLRLIFDACHGFGCSSNGRMFGNFGDVEVFSFHATKIVNGAEGGCITTNNTEIANRLRTIKNFHRSPLDRECSVRINGKMTEAQAAMALMALSNFERNVDQNQALYTIYKERLADRKDVELVTFDVAEFNNYQYAVFRLNERVELSRDDLLAILRAEGVRARRYFSPGVHNLAPYNEKCDQAGLPVTDELCRTLFQLPLGAETTIDDAEMIAELVAFVLDHAVEFKSRLRSL